MNDQTALHHLQALVDAQLVNEISAGEFVFRHALTREAVYATLLKRQRAAYHALVADALEGLREAGASGPGHVAELAYHYRQAAIWPKALAYAERAGEQAQELYAPHEAAEQFTHAVEAAGQLGQPPDLRVLRGRGQAYETLGEFERARADYESGLRLAREAGAAQAEWQALLDLGFLWAGRDYARTGEYFQQALALARTTGDPLTLARSLNRMGNWLVNTGRAADALRLHHEALEIFRQQGAQAEMADTYELLGLVYSLSGEITAGKENLERAIEIFRRVGDKRGLIASLAGHSSLWSNCDTLPWTTQTLQSCRQDAVEALALARQIGWLAGQAETHWLFAVTLGAFGEFGEALAEANAALQTAIEIEHRQWTTAAHCTLGQVYLWLLEPEAAIRHLGVAQPMAFELGSTWWISYTRAFMAMAHLLAGSPQAAIAGLKSAAEALNLEADWPAQPPRSLPERYLTWAWAEATLANGQPDEALRVADWLLDSAINPGGRPIPNLLKLKAEALMALGQLAAAQPLLDLALQETRERGARPVLWQVCRDRGRLAQRLGRPDEAGREFQAARAVIEELAATLDEGPLRETFLGRALSQLS